ncbi:hypothetical protein LCGC14_0652200 [marine sediment metagenome]|uniref:Uncharacterized protein n=1 Tax=marine sediment metagenome TaxID=412755 RepID=A0A0F9RFW3_9ZZZZ
MKQIVQMILLVLIPSAVLLGIIYFGIYESKKIKGGKKK